MSARPGAGSLDRGGSGLLGLALTDSEAVAAARSGRRKGPPARRPDAARTPAEEEQRTAEDLLDSKTIKAYAQQLHYAEPPDPIVQPTTAPGRRRMLFLLVCVLGCALLATGFLTAAFGVRGGGSPAPPPPLSRREEPPPPPPPMDDDYGRTAMAAGPRNCSASWAERACPLARGGGPWGRAREALRTWRAGGGWDEVEKACSAEENRPPALPEVSDWPSLWEAWGALYAAGREDALPFELAFEPRPGGRSPADLELVHRARVSGMPWEALSAGTQAACAAVDRSSLSCAYRVAEAAERPENGSSRARLDRFEAGALAAWAEAFRAARSAPWGAAFDLDFLSAHLRTAMADVRIESIAPDLFSLDVSRHRERIARALSERRPCRRRAALALAPFAASELSKAALSGEDWRPRLERLSAEMSRRLAAPLRAIAFPSPEALKQLSRITFECSNAPQVRWDAQMLKDLGPARPFAEWERRLGLFRTAWLLTARLCLGFRTASDAPPDESKRARTLRLAELLMDPAQTELRLPSLDGRLGASLVHPLLAASEEFSPADAEAAARRLGILVTDGRALSAVVSAATGLHSPARDAASESAFHESLVFACCAPGSVNCDAAAEALLGAGRPCERRGRRAG